MSTSARKHAAAAVLLLLALITSLVFLAKPSGVAAADTTPSGVSAVSGVPAIACTTPQAGIAQVTLTNAQPGTPLVARVVALVDGTTEGTPVLASFTAGDGTALTNVVVQLPDPLGITSKIQITDVTNAAPPQVIDVPTTPDGTALACDPSVVVAPALTATTAAPVCSTDLTTQSDATVDVQLTADQSAFGTATSVDGAINVVRETTNELGQTTQSFSLTSATPSTGAPLLFLSAAPANYLIQAVMSDGLVQVVSGSAFTAGACPVAAPTTPTATATPTDPATDTATPTSSSPARPSTSDSGTPVDSATPTPSDTAVVPVPPVTNPPIVPESSPAVSSSIAVPSGSSSPPATAAPSSSASAEATRAFQGPVGPVTVSSSPGSNNIDPSRSAEARPTGVFGGPVASVVATSHVQLPLLADQPSTSKPAVRLLAWHQDAALIVGIDAVAVSALVGATVWSARRR